MLRSAQREHPAIEGSCVASKFPGPAFFIFFFLTGELSTVTDFYSFAN